MPRAFEPGPDNVAVAQLVHLHADLGGRLLACQAQASRLTGGPLETREIAVRLLASQGIAEPTLTGALQPTLDKHAGKTVERVGAGMPARWVLAK